MSSNWRGLIKHLPIFFVLVTMLALFAIAAPAMAKGPVCKDSCGKALKDSSTSPTGEFRCVKFHGVGHNIFNIKQEKYCTVTTTYKYCLPMAFCPNTGCAVSGSPYQLTLHTQTKCFWQNVGTC